MSVCRCAPKCGCHRYPPGPELYTGRELQLPVVLYKSSPKSKVNSIHEPRYLPISQTPIINGRINETDNLSNGLSEAEFFNITLTDVEFTT